MGSVNRVSLRAELDGLKGQFEALCARGRISAEGRALIQALLMLFELLMAVFMEKSTPKNSRNASVPPSRTPKDDDTASRPGAARPTAQSRPWSAPATPAPRGGAPVSTTPNRIIATCWHG